MVVRKVLLLFLALVAGGAFTASPVMACPTLLKAAPRVGSTVAAPVNRISLYFSGTIDPSKSDLAVFDAQGHNVTTGKPQGSGDPVDTVFVPVKSLGPGTYRVKWHIHCNCQEGQTSIFPGSYSFVVK